MARARSDGSRGSPPHAWGIRVAALAYVGVIAVHPHTRGEYAPGGRQEVAVDGSPPHAWGILWPPCSISAGNPVHPHTRGEYPL